MLPYLFLLLIIVFAAFVLNDIKKQLNQPLSFAVIILLFLNVVVFILMEIFTNRVDKSMAISSNGNIGILIMGNME